MINYKYIKKLSISRLYGLLRRKNKSFSIRIGNLIRRMNVTDAIKKRRTVSLFINKPVSEDSVIRAIEAANYAPCHKLTFPWRFSIVNHKLRKNLMKEAFNFKYKKETCSEIPQQFKNKYLNPSHLIVARQLLHKSEVTRLEDYAACACAIQNLMLSLTSEGIGSKWATGEFINSDIAKKLLGLDSDKEKIIGFIWIGYGEASRSIKRPEVKEIISIL